MKRIATLLLALLLLLVAVVPALAYDNTVTYRGQGIIKDEDGSYLLETELRNKANGAEVDGPYLLWVLTATGASHADILFPGIDQPVEMRQSGNHGAFKYVTHWMDLSTLPGNVVATYDNEPKNVQLVISHGCRPKQKKSAWCSPGYWENTLKKTESNGWMTIGVDPLTTMFNGNVSPNYYANDLSTDQLLTYVLNNPGDFGGKLGTADPFGLTAFNAVGAYLTDQIDGYEFDPSFVGKEDACPLDAFGHFKTDKVSDFPSEGYAPAYVFIPAVLH